MENKIPKELQDILDKHTPMSRSNTQNILDDQNVPTIEMKVYSFDVFNNKLFVITQTDHIPYIQKYIDTVNNGNPDKDSVIREYAINQNMSESLIDRLLNNKNNNTIIGLPGRLYSELNRVEQDLKPILESIKRDKKIDNLLNGDISE